MPQSVLCDASSGVAPEALVAGNQALSSIAPGAAMAGGAAEFQAAARLLKISGANESGGEPNGEPTHTAQAAVVRRAKSAKLAGAAPVTFSTSLPGREPC